MRLHRLVPVLTGLAVSVALVVGGSAAAGDSAEYVAGDSAGNLVKVTVTGDKAGGAVVVRKGNPETQQTSPAGSDGGVIVGFVGNVDAGTTTLFTYDTASRVFHDLSALGRHIGAAAIYAHGTRVVYSRVLNKSYVIRTATVTGANPRTLYAAKSWKPWDIAITENGRRLFFAASQTVSFAGQPISTTHRSTVFQVTAHGRKRLVAYVADPVYYTQIQLTPGGGRLAVVRQRLSGSPQARLAVVTLSTGHVRTVLPSYAKPIAGVAWAPDGSSLVFRDPSGWQRLGLRGRVDAIANTRKLAYPVLASS